MDKESLKPNQGIILISEPSLQDYYFRQSVVLLAEHSKEGTFGVIINKPTGMRLPEIFEDLQEYDFQVYLGGPVKTDSVFFIHTLENVNGALEIMPGLYWGGDIQTIKSYIRKGLANEDHIRFFVGYSGWSPDQLEREIGENSWVLSHTTAPEVINGHPESLWSNYLKHMGQDYAIWANFPADPTLN
ncbi:MAG: YqgE/AlgH family protein [Bacteroidota bacterium]